MSSLNLGTCGGLVQTSMSGLALDSAGGSLTCNADGSYSNATANYPSGCGPVVVPFVATYWGNGAGKVFTVSGSRYCKSASTAAPGDSSSIDAQFATAAQQLAASGWFWGALSVGILFTFGLNSIAYGIGVIRRLVESGAE